MVSVGQPPALCSRFPHPTRRRAQLGTGCLSVKWTGGECLYHSSPRQRVLGLQISIYWWYGEALGNGLDAIFILFYLFYVRLTILVSRKWDCIPVDRKLLPYFLLLLALSSKCVLTIVVPRHPLLEHLINGNQQEFSYDMCRL